MAPGQYDVIDLSSQRSSHSSKLKSFRNIQNIVFPVNGEYAVKYEITYTNLIKRLVSSAYQILLIGLVSICASIFIGYILSVIVTNPIRKLTEVVKQIALGDFSKRAEVKSEDEVGLLADSVNHMAEDLEKSTEARIYQEKTKKELEIAAKIQKELLPTTLPNIKDLDLAAEVIPATEIGGDVYDVLIDKHNKAYFYVGDVTGHGVPAGLISSVTNAIITSTVDLADPIEIVANLNHVLKDKSAGNLFLTLLFARYFNNQIEYISAGHEKVIFYSAETNTTSYLEPGGIALGLFEEVGDKLELRRIDFKPGDVFLVYTDGIPEAWQSNTLQYGDEKLLSVADKIIKHSKSAQEIKDLLLQDVKNFMGTYEQKDDITVVVVRHT
jgi:sigma-B regulation protein RsbU (phosphoserine phosphatase)